MHGAVVVVGLLSFLRFRQVGGDGRIRYDGTTDNLSLGTERIGTTFKAKCRRCLGSYVQPDGSSDRGTFTVHAFDTPRMRNDQV